MKKNSAFLTVPLKFLCRVVLLAIIGLSPLVLIAKSVPVEPQRVTLNLKNVSLAMLFDELKKQTTYKFFYNDTQVRDMKTFSVTASNETVESVLDRVFKDAKYTYQINGEQIVVVQRKKETTSLVQTMTIDGDVLYAKDSTCIAGAAIIPTSIMDDWTPDFDAILDALNERTRMILLANPSNPIGAFALKSQVTDFLAQVPEEVIVVIDEELIDYEGQSYEDFYALLSLYPNVVLLRSFSHAYGLAGLRIGYMLSNEEICGICNVLRDPYNVSVLAQECAIAALQDKTFVTAVVKQTGVQRRRYRDFCAKYGFSMIDTRSCSVTIDFGANTERYYQELMRHGVFTRPLSYLGLNSLLNISLGAPDENTAVLKILETMALSDAYVLSRITGLR